MPFAFIIMQIGNKDMDAVCERAIVPAIEACGLEAKRVDKHNEGRLLNSEIARFISDADIVVADLTNERQNCYLEVGYTMGIGKYPRLVLAAREDHFHDSPNYDSRGPKIHFDLGGYNILSWDINNLDKYRTDLEKEIKRRQRTINSSAGSQTNNPDDTTAWFLSHISRARPASSQNGHDGGVEILLTGTLGTNVTLTKLNSVCESSPIFPHGTRVGMYWQNRNEARPKPMTGGIVAEYKEDEMYSYWAASLNGLFYQDLAYLEDSFQSRLRYDDRKLFLIDCQIMRATEALLYARNFYQGLGYSPTDAFRVAIRCWGLKDRLLSVNETLAAATMLPRIAAENDSEAVVITSIEGITNNLNALVMDLCEPSFLLFDFFQAKQDTYTTYINKLLRMFGLSEKKT